MLYATALEPNRPHNVPKVRRAALLVFHLNSSSGKGFTPDGFKHNFVGPQPIASPDMAGEVRKNSRLIQFELPFPNLVALTFVVQNYGLSS